MVYLENIYDVDTEIYDEVWLCVRYVNPKAQALLKRYNVRHVPALSPSTGLYNKYLEVDHWNERDFNSWYVPEFIQQMRSHSDAIDAMKTIQQKSSDKTIALCCYCKDEELCHRSILAGILDTCGVEVENAEKYKRYGSMY